MFLLGFLALLGAADYLIRDSIADSEREILAERFSEYRAWFLNGQFQELRSRFEEQSRRSGELYFVRIAGQGINSLLFSSPRGEDLLDEKSLRALAESRQTLVVTLKTSDPDNVWTVASGRVPGGYLLQAGRISTRAFEPANRFRRYFLWSVAAASLLALLGGGLLGFQTMKPVRDLTATAAGIIETGDLDRRVKVPNRKDDLAEMGILFNRMLDRNQSLIQSMKQSLDNTAHDLRTPISRMRATAETALAEATDLSQAREALSDCMEESDRILIMLNTLMDIAEAETGVMPIEKNPLSLRQLVNQIVDLYDLVAEENQVELEIDIPETLQVSADEARLQQAIANLLDNAIKYSQPKTRVVIRAGETQDWSTLSITDQGDGIADKDLPRIWDRLYRADQSRSKRGLGLGLSFVKAIVDAHGGTVEVHSQTGKGSTFTISLPK